MSGGKRARKEVFYGDPGALSLSDIRGSKKKAKRPSPQQEKMETTNKEATPRSAAPTRDGSPAKEPKKKGVDDAPSSGRAEGSKKKAATPGTKKAARKDLSPRPTSASTKTRRVDDDDDDDEERLLSRSALSSSSAVESVAIVRRSEGVELAQGVLRDAVARAAEEARSRDEEDAAFWRGKFEKLSAVRFTEPEAALQEALANAAALGDALRDGAAAPDAAGARQIADLQRAVNAYRLMTGLEVTRSRGGEAPSAEFAFDCTCTSDLSGRTFRFAMTLEDDVLIYTPTEGQDVLLDYLRDDLEFEAQMCPVMMSRILSSVHEPRPATETEDDSASK